MMELTIKNVVYQFKFGMGFMREVNKKFYVPVDGVQGATKNVGLRIVILKLYDGDTESLVDVLDVANKGYEPRVTRALLDEYIDDDATDIEKVFEGVFYFLKTANATKKETLSVLKDIEARKAEMEERAAEEGK